MKLLLLLLLVTSCGEHTPVLENHGDIVAANKLIISSDNHPALYGEKDCFLCHQEYSIHQVDRVDSLNLDLESIRESVKQNGIQSCSACHGTN